MTFVALWAFVCGAFFLASLTACLSAERERWAWAAPGIWAVLLFVMLGLV